MPERLATDAELRVLSDEVVSIPLAIRTFWLDFAGRQINTELYGDQASDAHLLLTLHHLALSPHGKSAGLEQGREATSEKFGGLAATFAASGTTGPHAATVWGRAFDAIPSLGLPEIV